jgi:hypothetical protein
VAEEFALKQLARDRCTIHFDQGSSRGRFFEFVQQGKFALPGNAANGVLVDLAEARAVAVAG